MIDNHLPDEPDDVWLSYKVYVITSGKILYIALGKEKEGKMLALLFLFTAWHKRRPGVPAGEDVNWLKL